MEGSYIGASYKADVVDSTSLNCEAVGEPPRETVYSYDGQGRLVQTTDSGKPDNLVTFRYDERGRKTKVQISRPTDYRPNVATAGSPFQVAEAGPNLPGGGSATTIYDEHDRPAEVQVRDAQGDVVSRAVRIYDAEGHIAEEKQILDNPETIIPAEMRAKILEASGASLEELRQHLTNMMGGQAGTFSIAYSYDAQGRVAQTLQRVFNQEHKTETTYNERGDKAAEIRRNTQIGSNKEQSDPAPGLTPYYEARYSYQYDAHGNWTEEILSARLRPSGAFESSSGRRRTLEYYCSGSLGPFAAAALAGPGVREPLSICVLLRTSSSGGG